MIGREQDHTPITMVIASTNLLVRLGLQAVIKACAHIQLIGEATSLAEAEGIIAREHPHLLMVEGEGKGEINMLELVWKLKASVPTMKIILLSGIENAHGTWQALSFGIDGIVLTIQPPTALLATIDYVCHRPAKAVLDQRNGTSPLDGPGRALATTGSSLPKGPDDLTKREHEIIDLVGRGLPNKDIADRLCICSTTVRHHLTSIFDKLGVTSRQQLLIRAHQHGLVELRTLA